jgi:hypothetical protein
MDRVTTTLRLSHAATIGTAGIAATPIELTDCGRYLRERNLTTSPPKRIPVRYADAVCRKR